MNSPKEPIFTRAFLVLCIVNFAFFTAFYMLIPVLPLYLLGELGASKGATGILLSLYVLSALAARPVAGMMLDTLPRVMVFILWSLLYVAAFAGYLWITPLVFFGLLRVVHGLAFGSAVTATNTLAVDVIPSARMGTGVGIFGITTAVPMAVGPMLGLLLYQYTSATTVFYCALAVAAVGGILCFASPRDQFPPRHTGTKKGRPQLFLRNAQWVGVGLACGSFLYGLVLNYISVYAQERGFAINAGFYFCMMAAGMIVSRLFAGRFIDSGDMGKVLLGGMGACFAGVVALFLPWEITFLLSALVFGLGVGFYMPACQTMFIKLASPEERGTANSSFFIAWDGGIGISLIIGGFLAEFFGFTALYVLGACILLLSIPVFRLLVLPRYTSQIRS